MPFQDLATELVIQVYFACHAITDVTALSSTCCRFRNIYLSSQCLSILETAAENQFGPLRDLTQLLTHNASQPAHIVRDVPFSAALLKQIVHAGRVAEKWCDIYPCKKWKYDFENRRHLTSDERMRLRRAIYRVWLYSRAFHNRDHPRELRATKLVLQRRAALLHNWNAWELAEMADVHAVMRELVQNNICPSNGTIARKFKKRHPEHEHSLLFNIHLNHPPPSLPSHNTSNSASSYASRFGSARYSLRSTHDVGAEGWGDDILHYYVVEDMLKMNPEQILWLRENAPLKRMVEMYVKSFGENHDGSNWFLNNGETWIQTLHFVLLERGQDVEDFMEALREGELGIAVVEAQHRQG